MAPGAEFDRASTQAFEPPVTWATARAFMVMVPVPNTEENKRGCVSVNSTVTLFDPAAEPGAVDKVSLPGENPEPPATLRAAASSADC